MAKSTAGNVVSDGETPNLDSVVAGINFDALDDVEIDDEDGDEEETEVTGADETAQEEPDGDGEENADDDDDEDMSKKAEAEDDKKDDKTPAKDKKETASEGGIAAALRHLDDTNPEHAKAVRELQGRLSRETVDRAQFVKDKEELAQILEEVRGLKDDDDGEQEPITGDAQTDSALAKIPENQRALFVAAMQEYLHKEGYKSETVAQAEQRVKEQAQYVATSDKEGIEKFGSAFADVDDDGNIIFDDDKVPRGEHTDVLRSTRDRVAAPDKGVTWVDLYKIARFDDEVTAAEQRGYEKAKAEGAKATRKAQAIKGSTVNGSTPSSPTRPSLYDRKKDKDPEEVYARAFRWADRHLAEKT